MHDAICSGSIVCRVKERLAAVERDWPKQVHVSMLALVIANVTVAVVYPALQPAQTALKRW
jgi:hypothetical protein